MYDQGRTFNFPAESTETVLGSRMRPFTIDVAGYPSMENELQSIKQLHEQSK